MMNKTLILLTLLFLRPCHEAPLQPPTLMARIVAYVHWEDQPLAGKKIELVQTGEIKLTDSLGEANFDVLPGKYVVRAYGINRGGPVYQTIDFTIEAVSDKTIKVDIVDCLPCV